MGLLWGERDRSVTPVTGLPVVPRHQFLLPSHSPSSQPPGSCEASGGGGPGAWSLPWPELRPVGRGWWCVRWGLGQRGTFRGQSPHTHGLAPQSLTQAWSLVWMWRRVLRGCSRMSSRVELATVSRTFSVRASSASKATWRSHT